MGKVPAVSPDSGVRPGGRRKVWFVSAGGVPEEDCVAVFCGGVFAVRKGREWKRGVCAGFSGGQVCLVAQMMPDERRIALEEAVALWKRSVRATHAFLTEEDIGSLVPSVVAGWLGVPELWSVRDAAGTMQAFMGIGGEMLEMLFVDPGWRACMQHCP